mmetsp:Transcript_25956/g.61583  ORF Transcript_25956/g.61583 Transcript_25956/m.61583 type:complete len:1125 (+) Transcript_25956:122-3496(+)
MLVLRRRNRSSSSVAAAIIALLSLCTTTTKVWSLPNPFEDGIDLTDMTKTPDSTNGNINNPTLEEEETVSSSSSSSSSSLLSIRLVDDQTGISPITTLLTSRPTSVYVDGWLSSSTSSSLLIDRENESQQQQQQQPISLVCTTYVDDVVASNGTMTFTSMESLLAFHGGDQDYISTGISIGSGLYCGSITSTTKMGTSSIRVEIQYEQGSISTTTTTRIVQTTTTDVRSYNSWVVSIPIVIPWLLFLGTNIPLELSLFVGAFVGSCILQGSFVQGFIKMFDTHLLTAVSDSSHVALMIFVVFMTTFVSLVAMSGGSAKVLELVSGYTSRSRLAQGVLFLTGCVFFFDPYSSIVVVGNILGPILKTFALSSEKFAYILDATALPVSSIIPVSTFVTIGTDLLQQELDNIDNFIDEQGISAASIMLGCIKYQFYPMLMLLLVIVQICSCRDAFWMLKIENITLTRFKENGGPYLAGPEVTNPSRLWNWWIPVVTIAALIGLSFGLVDFDSTSDNLSYSLAGWMTAAGASVIIIQLIFLFQTKKNGTLGCCGYHRGEHPDLTFLIDTFPSGSTTKSGEATEDEDDPLVKPTESEPKSYDEDFAPLQDTKPSEKPPKLAKKSSQKPRSLLNLHESFDCYLESGKKFVPLIFAIVASWATSDVYLSLGVDRIIAGWIIGESMTSKLLPIVTFFSSFLLSCVVGSAYTTMAILIPAVTAPALDIVDGSVSLFTFFLGSMVSGAVGGCHFGLYSDTTILSAITAESGVRRHFLSKSPYTMLVIVAGGGAGTVPVALGAYPDFAGILVGFGALLLFVTIFCSRTKSPWLQSENGNTKRQYWFGRQTDDKKKSDDKELTSPKDKADGEIEMDGDPIQELIEDGILPSSPRRRAGSFSSTGTPFLGVGSFASATTDLIHNTRSRSSATPLMHNRTTSTSATQLVKNSRRARSRSTPIARTTIQESEDETCILSPSLQRHVRIAETTLDKIVHENEWTESDEEEGSTTDGSHTSHTDDSLDNLVSNIQHHARNVVERISGSGSESETDDGESTDDGDSTVSGSVDYGDSTAFTGATSYTDEGETDDDASHSQMYSVTSSEFQKTEFMNSVISSVADESTLGPSTGPTEGPSKASV